MTTLLSLLLDVDGQSIIEMQEMQKIAASFPAAATELLGFRKRNKDKRGIPQVVEFYRPDETLARKHTVSGGETPFYTNLSIQFYAADGVTPTFEWEYTITYNGAIIMDTDLMQYTDHLAAGGGGGGGGEAGGETEPPA